MPQIEYFIDTFITDQELHCDKSKSWYSNLAMITKMLNIDNEDPIDHTDFLQILKDYYMKQTEQQLNKMKNETTDNKLHLFSHVLDLNKTTNYLQHTPDRNVTRDITKFVLSAHCLQFERGKYTKPKTPRSNRICPHCTLIETEEHFFMECLRYIQPRNKLYEAFEIGFTHLHVPIMHRLLNPRNRSETLCLHKFIKSALQLRNDVSVA